MMPAIKMRIAVPEAANKSFCFMWPLKNLWIEIEMDILVTRLKADAFEVFRSRVLEPHF